MRVPFFKRARKGAVVAALTVLSAAAVFAVTPRPIADMPIPMVNTKALDLKQYRGKVVLMAIISQECPACVASIEILNRAQKNYGPRGFQVVAAVGDPNAQYLLVSFAQRYRPIFPLGYVNQDQIVRLGDFDKSAPHAYVPIFIFIDRKGIVRQQVSGNEPFFLSEEANLRTAIENLLK
jgi:thiol-disulfide isomerase/thioredoxin